MSRIALLGISVLLQAFGFAQRGTPSTEPFTANFEMRSVRTLANGTTLTNSRVGRVVRDDRGRTRLERGDTIIIRDPGARTLVFLDLRTRIARRVRFQNQIPAEPVTVKSGPGAVEKALGTRMIEGMEADGKEYVVTFPAGSAVGNDRPIEQKLQIWMSTRLRVPLLTTMTDVINGEVTQRYFDVVVGNQPDTALLEIPATFKIIDQVLPAAGSANSGGL